MKKQLILTIVVFVGFCLSCKEDVLEKVNPNQLSIETYFNTGDEIVAAVNAVYATYQGTQLVAREWFFIHDLRGDDVQSGGGQLETPRAQLLEGTHTPSNPVMLSVWTGLYQVIHRANLVVENAPKAQEQVTEELKKRVIAEAKFLRAWAYFDLATFWGGVPLIKEADALSQPRATENEVFDFIIEDLTAAISDLPASYGNADLGRATKYAAEAMLARVYLFQGKYAEAKAPLADIYTNGNFELAPNYLDNFREEGEYNKESIFEIQFSEINGGSNWSADGSGTNIDVTFRGQEYGPTAWRNLIPSNGLINEFETTARGDAKNDPRYQDSFYFIGDTYNNGQNTITLMQGADPKISWKKYQRIYKFDAENSQSGINFRIIRFAEVLLMLAECENELGNATAAIGYLNEVRNRPSVDMPDYPTARFPCRNQAEIFAAIVHEKRVEHGGEQIRTRDIVRWRKLNKLPSEPLGYFQANKHELLPLPQQELDNNEKIEQANQNPGY